MLISIVRFNDKLGPNLIRRERERERESARAPSSEGKLKDTRDTLIKLHRTASLLPSVSTWGRGYDALVMDLLTFVGLLKFSVQNSGVMSSSWSGFVRVSFTPASHHS